MATASASAGRFRSGLERLEYGLEMRVVLDGMVEEPGLDVGAECRSIGARHRIDAIGNRGQAPHHVPMLGDVILDRRIRRRGEMARDRAPFGVGHPRLCFQLAQNGVLGSKVLMRGPFDGGEQGFEDREVLIRVHRCAEACDEVDQLPVLTVKSLVTNGKKLAPRESGNHIPSMEVAADGAIDLGQYATESER